MGLDITAYKKLSVVEVPKLDEDGELVNWETEWIPGESMVWSEKHFPGRGEGIDPKKAYTWEDAFGFCAGSYSGYNWWRRQLEKFAEGEEFQELINFADNEGVIGFVVSKKLAEDFNDNMQKAVNFSESLGDESKYWLESYLDWKRAFEVASDNGAVEFR